MLDSTQAVLFNAIARRTPIPPGSPVFGPATTTAGRHSAPGPPFLSALSDERSELMEKSPSSSAVGFCSMSREKKFTVVTFCLSNFCVGAFYALLAPFYPTEVREKDYFLITFYHLIIINLMAKPMTISELDLNIFTPFSELKVIL